MSVRQFIDQDGVSFLWNKIKENLDTKANENDLATVATSGSYNDLLNKPFIPSAVSDLTDDSGHYTKPATGIPASDLEETYLTQHQDISGKANIADLAAVATSGSYNDLSNKPFIPNAISDLTDDSGHYTKPVGGIPASDLANGVLDVWSGLTYHTSTMSTDSDSFVLGGATDAPTEINKCLVTSTPDANVIPKFDYQGRLHSVTPEEEWDGSNAVATTEYVDNMISDNMPEIPTNVSELNNDAGYLTEHQDISGKANSADLATVATSGDYNDLLNKPTIPDIQIEGYSIVNNGVANIPHGSDSQLGVLRTDARYGIAGSAEGVPQLSKASLLKIKEGTDEYRPIVPANEHEATFYGLASVAGDTTQSQSDNAVGTYTDSAKTAIQNMLGVPAASAIPTLVSQLTNDSGYLTSFTETDPTVPSWAKAAQKPTYTAAEVGAPTVQEMNTAIGNAIGNINSFDMAVVQALPIEDISTHTIYLVPKTGETNDVYDEYVYINSNWEMVGNTQIDLSNYVQKTDIATDSIAGVVKVGDGTNGIKLNSQNILQLVTANLNDIKTGTTLVKPVTPGIQSYSIFYGLAKAAGDTTQSQSNNVVGTYTTEAKAAIRSMLGAAASADIPSVPVQDVQIKNTSILNNGIANIPLAANGAVGLVQGNNTYGTAITAAGDIMIYRADDSAIKNGNGEYKPIVPYTEHQAVFYGLAKAAGDTTQKVSTNAVGTYTVEAKTAILNMFGLQLATDTEIQNIINGGAGA